MRKKAFTLLLALVAIATTARAQVVLNETNFPDANFRAALAKTLGISEGDEITETKILQTTSLDVSGKSIANLKGIEHFNALKILWCINNQLISLDVSKNTALEKLYLSQNQLTSLDVSSCTALIHLSCANNQLTSLNVSGCSALTELSFFNNQLTSLNLSKNTKLTKLDCGDNQLTSLDVSHNTALTSLSCDNNQLTSLDVSGCTALTKLNCGRNQLTTLDVSNNIELTELGCTYNQLTSLDVSGFSALSSLYCENNPLTSLDVSGCIALTKLRIISSQLISLDASGCTALTELRCFQNQLTSLDVSGCTALSELWCFKNKLTSLNVSGCSALTVLKCYSNKIKKEAMDAIVERLPTVNIGKFYVFDTNDRKEGNACTKVHVAIAKEKGWTVYDYYGNREKEYDGIDPNIKAIVLNAENFPDAKFRKVLESRLEISEGDEITEAKISTTPGLTVSNESIADLTGIEHFITMTSFSCGSNKLTSLDVSQSTKMFFLSCIGNRLASLDVSKNTALRTLYCNRNQLSSLDVSKNAVLTNLYCNDNQLSSLDVSGCTNLEDLDCTNNQLTSLDVSKNAALKTLKCNSNRLTSLNTAGCSALTELNCDNNPLTSLNVSGCSALTELNCNYQLTSLNVSGCTALTKLNCNYNQLTSLYVSGCTALTELNCCGNLINGDAMNALIESLPTVENGIFYVIDTQNESEGNVCSKSQVAIVKAKGWTVYDYNGGIIQEYEGSDDPEQEIDPVDEDTDISQIDNTIYIERVEAATGRQLRLSIKMKNTIEVQGYQFDLYLPEGVSFATDEDGFVLAELSEERTTPKKMNSFDTAIQSDGSLRVLCGSSKGYTFDGTDGEVAIITLNIDANMEEGEYPLILKTVKLSDRNSVPYSTDYLKSTLVIYSYTLADANGDSSIDVADYIAVANYILGNAPDNFVSKAADINEDNSIDVADYIGVANLILSGAGATNAPSFARFAAKAPLQMATDITTLDDAIYVTPITASPGTQQELSIQMKNSSNVVGFEFSLKLPDGITVALDEDNMPMAELSTERTTTKRTTSFDSAIQPNGTLKVLCGTTAQNSTTGKLYTFNGNEGEIARITIEIPANYEEGVYEVSILNALFADEDSKKTTLQSPINSELTIGDNYTILDEESTTVPDASTGNVNILVKRTIKANEWSTICLPFDMTEEQLYGAFGNDVQLQEFVSYDATYDANDEVVGIVVNFQNVDLSEGLYGNYPYLIKTSNAISEFSANATIAPDEENTIAEYDNGRTGKARKVWGSFIGTYHAQTMIPENGLFISGNNFWYSVGTTKMKAFRAYFIFDDVLSSLNAASAKITWMFDGQPTSIDKIESEKITDGAVYTIQGQFVGRGINTKTLPSGIYIMNGQKVVIK